MTSEEEEEGEKKIRPMITAEGNVHTRAMSRGIHRRVYSSDFTIQRC